MRTLMVIGSALLLTQCEIGKVWEGVGGSASLTSTGTGSSSGNASSSGNGSSSGDGFGGLPGSTTSGDGSAPLISPDAPGCARGQISATVVPVDFLFTIDHSGSMDDSANNPTKWKALQTAMLALLNDLDAKAIAGDKSVAVGINYFSDDDGHVEFAPQLLDDARAQTLMTDLEGRTAGGSTATLAALTESYQSITAFNPTGSLAGGQKVVVLVSDGVPNPLPPDPATIPNLVNGEFKDSPSILTFSIGVGEIGSTGDHGYDANFMSNVAYQGGTGKSGCDPTSSDPAKFCHFQITPSASTNLTGDFENAFNAIRDQVASCTLKLDIQDAADLEPRAVVVVEQVGTTQTILAHDSANGWTFDNDTHPTLIVLHGQDCQQLHTSPPPTVFAILGCACGTTTGPGASTAGGGGEGSTPAREVEGGTGSSSGGGFNTNWCSYPFATPPAGTCTGEGCPP